MDHARFDRIARSLANPLNRRTGLLAALALAAGIGEVRARQRADGSEPDPIAERRDAARPGASGREAARRRRRKRCRPACGPGFTCERGRCVCGSGVACGAACCAAGEACIGGACAAPTPTATPTVCLAPGTACGGGRPCCAGLACGSGQGGGAPVCCQVDGPRTCASTAECCFGWECRDGRCVAVVPPTPTPTWRYAACPAPDQGVGGWCVVGATCCEGGGCCPPATPVCCRNAEGGGCCPATYRCFRRGNGHGFCCPPGTTGNQLGRCV